jgi:hypothetical protein
MFSISPPPTRDMAVLSLTMGVWELVSANSGPDPAAAYLGMRWKENILESWPTFVYKEDSSYREVI